MPRYILRRLLTVLAVFGLILIPIASTAAQANNCQITVQPGDTIFGLARRFNTSTSLIVRVNNLANPNLIRAGDELLVPIGIDAEDECPSAAAATNASQRPTTGATGATAATAASAGAFTIEIGDPLYSGDGSSVEIPVTVHNQSVSPAIAGGKYNTDQKEDGNFEDVTLVKSLHGDFETPIPNNALLWQANVHTSDGQTHLATVGCRFIEHVFAEGDEPLERDQFGNWLRSFHYEINLYDGWFDCGNTYRVNPENIAPGASASSVLNIYLINPHFLEATGERIGQPYPERYVTQLDFTLFTPTGAVAGTQSLAVPLPQTAAGQ